MKQYVESHAGKDYVTTRHTAGNKTYRRSYEVSYPEDC